MDDEERQEWVEMLAAKLHEEFDAVQILCSHNEDGFTKAFYTGAGSWYARQGMAHEFIDTDKSQVAAKEMSKIVIRTEPPDAA